MKYEEFVCCMQTKMQEKLGDEVRIELHQVTKNNDIVLDGMTFYQHGTNMAPTVYLNDLYQEYIEGKTIPEITEHVCELYHHATVAEEFRPEEYLNYEKVKTHLACKLINYKKNERLLKEIPYQKFLNLAVVAYYKVEDEKIGNATILVRNSHCRSWGVTEQEVLMQARDNTQKILPVKFVEIGEVLEECGYESEQGVRMYVLTNEENYFGASAIIFDSILEKISILLKDDFWILPSSIHVCIIVPADYTMSAEGMRDLVREVNQAEVAPQDYLSDEIYYYQCQMHRLTCVDAVEEKTDGTES